MKKLLIACMAIVLYACTEAGEGSGATQDSTGSKDTMKLENSGGSATTPNGDTASYERMPSRTSGDTLQH
jgi:hypothetical protein